MALTLLSLMGCAAVLSVKTEQRLDQQYGPENPAKFDATPRPVPNAGRQVLDYDRQIQPLLDKRCVLCHACYDAPCQLKLSSYEGLTRGANPKDIYANRLMAAPPTRLYLDAHSNAQWRSQGFFPVLNERESSLAANREAGVMHRLLALKQSAAPNAGPLLAEQDFDLSLDRKAQCPRIEDMAVYEAQHPQWGMPFGLPALSEPEHRLLSSWLAFGAPRSAPKALPASELAQVEQWERFLNADSLKAQLMSRYIYEHWFVGHLYFDGGKTGQQQPQQYYQLLRSSTPPGEPIAPVATRRPYDDPGVPRVYYRLRPHQESIVNKTHLPLALNPARMARLKRWFLEPSYAVNALPSYEAVVASNPFVTFRALPVESRHRFLLDEAQFIFAAFMKGPVCRGQVALNVINDHFWVLFSQPGIEVQSQDEEALAASLETLRMPAEHESSAGLLSFRGYAKLEQQYLQRKSEFMNTRFGARSPVTLKTLWSGRQAGEAPNPNAALTAFRHFDSASVVQGLHGERPQTVLVLDFALFERIYYLLVSGFDIYGNVGHQLATRLYMDFLRMEGEFNFLALLPKASRQSLQDHWYRGASPAHIEQLNAMRAYFEQETGLRFKTAEPLTELYATLRQHYAGLDGGQHRLETAQISPASKALLEQLSNLQGRAASVMPELSYLWLQNPGAATGQPFSLLRHSAHLNVASPFGEEKKRLPDEDRLQVLQGYVGAYPNALLRVDEAGLKGLVTAISQLGNEADYAALMQRYGVRRTDAGFWAHSDRLLEKTGQRPIWEAGLFDYSRLENR